MLAFIILFTSVITMSFSDAEGQTVDCSLQVQTHNSAIPDTSALYTGLSTKDSIKTDLDALDKILSSFISSINPEGYLYTDEVASAITKYSAILVEKELSAVTYTAMQKSFPEAYDFIKEKQDNGASWDDIETIPFGITKGDKKEFIKACGAGAEHIGNSLLEVIVYEPTAYYTALVPALESTHTGTMPSMVGFVARTGLSPSKRIEFLIEKVLDIIEPIKASPLTYLLDILPDFIVNYSAAAELLNGNSKIQENVKLALPEIESIVSGLIKALGITAPDLDYDYMASLGTAKVGKSAGNKGERTVINGDREALFQYLADYITGLFTYENNYSVFEDLLLSKIKTITQPEIRTLIYSQSTNDLLASLLDILSKNVDSTKYVQAMADAYNSKEKDSEALFGNFFSRERVSSLIDTLDKTLASELREMNLETSIYTDTIATLVAKFTAELCGAELSEISTTAMKASFPEAYNYVEAAKRDGKTWAEIGTIPFGIREGDKDAFIKACGAGSEHFGDVLALCCMVAPTSYDDALIPIFEALHIGSMPTLKEFVASSGLDGAKRMEDIALKLLGLIDPLMDAPVSYLCEILPDVVNSYNNMAEYISSNEDIARTGLKLKPINDFVKELLLAFSLQLPEYDILTLADLGTAKTETSGDRCAQRMAIYGDKEAVFVTLFRLVIDVVGVDGNVESIVDTASDLLDIDLSFLVRIFNMVKTVWKTADE